MTESNFDASQTAQGTAAKTNLTTRTAQLQQLYATNYSNLQSVAYEAYPHLMVFDADKIMTLLAERLHKFKGSLDDNGVSFEKWATRWVSKEAQRYKILAEILAEHSGIIHKSIQDNLWTSVQDRSVEHNDVFAGVMVLVFARAHSLKRRGRAKLTTRLYSLTKKHCWLKHNSRNKRHRNGVQRHLEQGGELGGCEVMSAAEIASLKAFEVYDPGYGEIGLSIT
jgi:hypothetical protein